LPILQAAGCRIVERVPEDKTGVSHVITTAAAGEAVKLAQELTFQDYDAILCIGGDGIVHEVINGLASRRDGSQALNNVAIATIPAGSISI
jgi:sphingosine kinase